MSDLLELIEIAVTAMDIINAGVELTLEQNKGYAGGSLFVISDNRAVLSFSYTGNDGEKCEAIINDQPQVMAVVKQVKQKFERLYQMENPEWAEMPKLSGYKN
jgi:hypothetical protein